MFNSKPAEEHEIIINLDEEYTDIAKCVVQDIIDTDETSNKEQINQVLISHAVQGWNLVTMYSNEFGKNSMGVAVGGVGGGTNTTMCEDVMVFERCIKAGE